MIKDKSEYTILIIEDNPGDLFIFQEHLKDQILNPKIHVAHTYKEAEVVLASNEINLDIIFLDLSLPDKNGVDLIHEIVPLSAKTPIVVLTGYLDIEFSIKSLHLGISDYLIKDKITSLTLYKSLRYTIERGKYIVQVEQSEKRYMDLFQFSPQPMWIYDIDTLYFLEVNNAAVEHYGFSYEEFLTMSIKEIRPKEEEDSMMEVVHATRIDRERKYNGFTKHQKKNGQVITVEITSNIIVHNGKTERIILANDITERLNYIEAIVAQNKNLKEIAWVQSHVVRTPLARMMGLIKMLQNNKTHVFDDSDFLYTALLKSADELDLIIREISDKASKIEANNKKYDLGDSTN